MAIDDQEAIAEAQKCCLSSEQCQWCRDGMKECAKALALLERIRKTGDDVEEAIKQVQDRYNTLQGYLTEFGPKPDSFPVA